MFQLRSDILNLDIDPDGNEIYLNSPKWLGFSIGPLTCNITIDGVLMYPSSIKVRLESYNVTETICVISDYESAKVKIIQSFFIEESGFVSLHNELENYSGKPVTLNRITLLELAGIRKTHFGADQKLARVLQDWGYSASVKPISDLKGTISSRALMVVYNPIDSMAYGAGYTTYDRWNGVINFSMSENNEIASWWAGFDGGDTLISTGNTPLEDMVFMIGSDPWKMLEDYGDIIQRKYNIRVLDESPVSWCSWYPHRLGVSEERVLANAEIAEERLKPLGLKYMLLDLGWQEGHLPSTFTENDQFPHGLKWLSDRLESRGFSLGTWTAPYSISEFDPLCKEHPDWLIKDENGKPKGTGQWFWQPHGDVYCLDLTNPEAQNWLRERIESLAQRGSKYIKPDFSGIITGSDMRNRYDRRIVAGGGIEAAKIGAKIIEEAITSVDKTALPLNCGTETAGIGHFKLLYTCNDTGNTGYVGWNHLKETYTTVACHLFKNKRWAIIQPSCLCVGLPGTLEEARVRATATFLCGGQVDIGDELTALPEDRWKVLLATLPTLGISAKVIDLFEPITEKKLSYEGMSSGNQTEPVSISQKPNASVWHLHLENDWDKWDLVGLFDYNFGDKSEIANFKIPLEKLNLDPAKDYWAYEFWSGQFLGKIPSAFAAPHGYLHPGDAQRLIATSDRGNLELSFFGPGVKLIALREVKPHPWIVGTSFHQSCGMELNQVVWNEDKKELSGTLKRPKGQQGFINVVGLGDRDYRVITSGGQVNCVKSANGSILIPIITEDDVTSWKVSLTD